MRHITLASITGTTILVPSFVKVDNKAKIKYSHCWASIKLHCIVYSTVACIKPYTWYMFNQWVEPFEHVQVQLQPLHSFLTCSTKRQLLTQAHFTSSFSIKIAIRLEISFCFLTSILVKWLLQTFAYDTTFVLSWHVQKFVEICKWWPQTENKTQQNKISFEFELWWKNLYVSQVTTWTHQCITFS